VSLSFSSFIGNCFVLNGSNLLLSFSKELNSLFVWIVFCMRFSAEQEVIEAVTAFVSNIPDRLNFIQAKLDL